MRVPWNERAAHHFLVMASYMASICDKKKKRKKKEKKEGRQVQVHVHTRTDPCAPARTQNKSKQVRVCWSHSHLCLVAGLELRTTELERWRHAVVLDGKPLVQLIDVRLSVKQQAQHNQQTQCSVGQREGERRDGKRGTARKASKQRNTRA